MKTRGLVSALALGAALWSATPPSSAVTFDVASDFSLASNPNGVWSYGYEASLGSKLVLYDLPVPNVNDILGLDNWSSSIVQEAFAPEVGHNRTSSDLFVGCCVIPAHSVQFHPGPNGEFSIIRWTAPTSDNFRLSVAFGGDDLTGTTTDVHVLLNGIELFSDEVNGFGPAGSFSDVVSVQPGDIIDFAVGFGSNQSFGNDTTGISATLRSVPEPADIALIGLVGIALSASLYRRQRLAGRDPIL